MFSEILTSGLAAFGSGLINAGCRVTLSISMFLCADGGTSHAHGVISGCVVGPPEGAVPWQAGISIPERRCLTSLHQGGMFDSR